MPATVPLAPLLPVAELYDYRGEQGEDEAPPLWLPYNQGDVFKGVDLPGLEVPEVGSYSMLFQHPCTMRAGAVLKDRVVMLRVNRVTRKEKDEAAWWAGRGSVMPLPNLLPNEPWAFAGDFLSIATVASAALGRHRRIASLSLNGRQQFQQRIISYLTRFRPSLAELEEATEAVETEISLQATWVEAAYTGAEEHMRESAISDAEKAFDEFMASEGRRGQLATPEHHLVSSDVHAEIGRLYSRD